MGRSVQIILDYIAAYLHEDLVLSKTVILYVNIRHPNVICN